MNSTRRSFLAAIVAAVAQQAFPQESQQSRLVREFDELWVKTKRLTVQDAWRPFWIWENIELDGKTNRVQICPPPLPPEMVLTETAIAFDSATPYRQMADVLKSWEIRMQANKKDLFAGSIRFLCYTGGRCMSLMPGLRLLQSDNVNVELAGDQFDTPEAVKMQVIFKGAVRL
jgi:hypothetical protein